MHLRQLVDADWDAFIDFCKRHFGDNHPVDGRFFSHWFRNPWFDGWACFVLERPDKSLAGAMLLVTVPVWFAKQETTMHWISTIAVDSDAQVRGAGAKLFLWAHRSLPLVGSMCGNELSIPISNALGLTVPHLQMRRFIFVHSHKVMEICEAEKREQIQALIFEPRSPREFSQPVLEAQFVDSMPRDFKPLWERTRENLVCSTNRQVEFMNWRYVHVPHVDYRFVAIRTGDRLCGFAVLRMQVLSHGLAGRIIDFIADEEVSTRAWISVLSIMGDAGAIFSDFLVMGTRHDCHLTQAGLILATDVNGLEGIPNLLSPIDYRQWSYSFHLGGKLAHGDQSWRYPDAVYFTKGDSDRDWPTVQLINKMM